MKREPLMEITPDQPENKFFFSAYAEVEKWEPNPEFIDPTVKERCMFMADKLAKRLKIEEYTPDWNTRSKFFPEILAVGIMDTSIPVMDTGWWFSGFRLVLDAEPYWQACLGFTSENGTDFVDIADLEKNEFWINTAPRKNLYKGTQIILNAWLDAENLFETNVREYMVQHKIMNMPRKVELEFNGEGQLIRIFPKKKEEPVVVAYKQNNMPVILDLPVYWAIINSDSRESFVNAFNWPL